MCSDFWFDCGFREQVTSVAARSVFAFFASLLLCGTVAAVHVNEGDKVKAGQLLLELDPEKRQFAAEQAQQQVQHALAALKEAQPKLQRRRNLAEQETITGDQLPGSIAAA